MKTLSVYIWRLRLCRLLLKYKYEATFEAAWASSGEEHWLWCQEDGTSPMEAVIEDWRRGCE